ncbi:hypothetical protein VP1G_10492 [Cytospora mali]|uniref:Uncharacterized protein n=1 Tax=Cytospora mali TaxID=578113 RepID=A0A194UME4_CYTMA|nr:hypothetical protein VP1G_10492 [Valsa mali var. pyri (nom. inval.)]
MSPNIELTSSVDGGSSDETGGDGDDDIVVVIDDDDDDDDAATAANGPFPLASMSSLVMSSAKLSPENSS